MSTMTTRDGKWLLTYAPAAAGTKTITLATENKFMDKSVDIDVAVAQGVLAAQAGTTGATASVQILTEAQSQPASGAYITVTGKGKVKVGTAGWLAADTELESNTATKYYTIQNAQFQVDGRNVFCTTQGYVAADSVNPVGQIALGEETVTGGGLTAGAGATALASDGYYNGTSYDSADKVALSTTEAEGFYKVTSTGSGTVNRAAVTKQVTTAGYFNADSSPVQKIAADSLSSNEASAEYFIKKSTLSASVVTSSNVDQTVTIGEGYYPAARTVTITGMTEVTPTTSLANTGLSTYFNAGTSGDKDISLTPQYSNTAGYVAAHTNQNNGGVEYYKIKTTSVTEGTTTVASGTVTRGTATWGTGWITTGNIGAATFANSGSSGVTYVDLSDTTEAPVLVAGDFLYINQGYVDNLKISLKKLVPDGSDVKGHSEYILSGHSAYDNDGTLVAGSIQTYDGSYTIA